MAQHKWHKEIIAWAEGKTIEVAFAEDNTWAGSPEPDWNNEHLQFRIQPPMKYVYVHQDYKTDELRLSEFNYGRNNEKFIGRIKIDTKVK